MKSLVEVSGIEPESLDNQIEAATCLVCLLVLTFSAPVDRIGKDAAFYALAPVPKANLPEPACLRSLLGHRQPKERPA